MFDRDIFCVYLCCSPVRPFFFEWFFYRLPSLILSCVCNWFLACFISFSLSPPRSVRFKYVVGVVVVVVVVVVCCPLWLCLNLSLCSIHLVFIMRECMRGVYLFCNSLRCYRECSKAKYSLHCATNSTPTTTSWTNQNDNNNK